MRAFVFLWVHLFIVACGVSRSGQTESRVLNVPEFASVVASDGSKIRMSSLVYEQAKQSQVRFVTLEEALAKVRSIDDARIVNIEGYTHLKMGYTMSYELLHFSDRSHVLAGPGNKVILHSTPFAGFDIGYIHRSPTLLKPHLNISFLREEDLEKWEQTHPQRRPAWGKDQLVVVVPKKSATNSLRFKDAKLEFLLCMLGEKNIQKISHVVIGGSEKVFQRIQKFALLSDAFDRKSISYFIFNDISFNNHNSDFDAKIVFDASQALVAKDTRFDKLARNGKVRVFNGNAVDWENFQLDHFYAGKILNYSPPMAFFRSKNEFFSEFASIKESMMHFSSLKNFFCSAALNTEFSLEDTLASRQIPLHFKKVIVASDKFAQLLIEPGDKSVTKSMEQLVSLFSASLVEHEEEMASIKQRYEALIKNLPKNQRQRKGMRAFLKKKYAELEKENERIVLYMQEKYADVLEMRVEISRFGEAYIGGRKCETVVAEARANALLSSIVTLLTSEFYPRWLEGKTGKASEIDFKSNLVKTLREDLLTHSTNPEFRLYQLIQSTTPSNYDDHVLEWFYSEVNNNGLDLTLMKLNENIETNRNYINSFQNQFKQWDMNMFKLEAIKPKIR